MLQSLRLLNPLVRISDEAEARAAARAGAVALFLMAAMSVVGIATQLLDDTWARVMRASFAMSEAANPDSAGLGEAMMPFILGLSVFMSVAFGVGYLVLGVVQWKKQTRVSPPVLLLLVACFVLAATFSRFVGPTAAIAEMLVPLWRWVLSMAVNLVMLTLFIVGFRGGTFLNKLRGPAPANA